MVVEQMQKRAPLMGLKLSGGGVRAALFALGVLTYLGMNDLQRHIQHVHSVSGGSIVNARLAVSGDISKASSTDFLGDCASLASHLANRGTFFLPRTRAIAAIVVAISLVITLAVIAHAWTFNAALRWQAGSVLELLVWPALPLVGIWALLATFFYIALRRYAQYVVYERLIRDLMAPRESSSATIWGDLLILLGRGHLRLSDLPDSDVTHVLCATELISGKPIFFSRDWILSEPYGCGPPTLRLSSCVYASAAFPAVFPAQPIRLISDQWNGGVKPGERPNRLVVVDGGVYNNLATEFEPTIKAMQQNPHALPRSINSPMADIDLIVNASSPSRATPLNRWWPVRIIPRLLRSVTVLYENTVRPRASLLEAGGARRRLVIDIAQSPLRLATAIRDAKDDVQASTRAERLANSLHAEDPTYWEAHVHRSAAFRTTLSVVENSDAAHIMRHGYLLTSVAMAAYLGAPGPDGAPEELWFNTIIKTGRMPSSDPDGNRMACSTDSEH